MHFILLDVDGTITEPRLPITPEMYNLIRSITDAKVYLVTGSNIEKTIEQCGDLIDYVSGTFACSGNAFYVGRRLVFQNNWSPPNNVINWLQSELAKSTYPARAGNHIEIRPGSLNFSIVGRNANHVERQDYKLYDLANHERLRIAGRFEKKFGNLTAKIGGDTGIDIAPKGNDKSQVFKYLAPLIWLHTGNVYFFGDRIAPSGNDEPLATILTSSLGRVATCVEVTGPAMTANLINQIITR